MTSYGKKQQRSLRKHAQKEEQAGTKPRLNEMIRLLRYAVWLLFVIALILFAFFLRETIAIWIS